MIELKNINDAGKEKLVSWNKGESEEFLWQWCGKKAYNYPITLDQVEIRSKRIDFDLFSILFDGQIVGSLELTKPSKDKNYVRLGKFIIGSEFRGQGLGSKALNYIFKFVPTYYGVTKLELGVFRFNSKALSLYKRLGFKESQVVVSDNDSRWDSITMNKVLI